MPKFHRLRSLLKQFQGQLLVRYRLIFQPTLVEIDGIKLKIDDYFSQPIKKNIYQGYYENGELNIIKSQLLPDDIVMEIGAGIGFISTYCAKQIGSERVFAYEANPDLEERLRNTYQLNKVSPALEMCLVENKIGERTFYIEKNFWSSSIIPRSQDAKAITLPVKSFNEEIQRHNPTFLIIDIEGGEFELFKNADFFNVKKIMLELHNQVIGEEKVKFVKDRLLEAGFKMNEKYYCQQYGKEELFWERN